MYAVENILLFIAYTMLINIIWQYVININDAITKKKCRIMSNRERVIDHEIKIVHNPSEVMTV